MPEIGCIMLNCWPKESHRPSQTLQAIANDIVYSLKPVVTALLLKIQRSLDGKPIAASSLLTYIHNSGRYFAPYQKRKINHKYYLATNAVIYNSDLPAKYTSGTCYGSNDYFLFRFKTHA